ncbi:hypothetical protein ACFLX5_04265 [Chloroflexota bacterium]
MPLYSQPIRAQETPFAPTESTTEVNIYIGVIDIPHIDEPGETYDLDAYLTLVWEDPAAYDYIKEKMGIPEGTTYMSLSKDGAHEQIEDSGWLNIIQFTNQVGDRHILNASLRILPTGEVTYDERFQATLSSKFYLKSYPFDSQKLHIEIETFNLDINDVLFAASQETITFYKSPKYVDADFELEEWFINPQIDVYVGEYTSNMTGRTYSYVSIDILANRKTGFHIWKIFLPLILILAVSWSVFWIARENVSSRLSISSIGFLSAISFNFFVSSSLPKISYLTFMDRFIAGVFLFMALTVIVVLIMHFATERGKLGIVSRMNQQARWIFPAIFGIYMLVTTLALS